VITSIKRLSAALAFVVSSAALVASPAMATTHTHANKAHHSVHKASSHKMHSKKTTTGPTAS
jgi:hypothetical protein